ncbi:RNA polymerase sigma factor SigZ [Vibrio splendidus]
MTIENIWQEYRLSLKAFLHSKVSNASDVDDLLQDILIKSYENLGKLRSGDKIKPWIFQIANHTIIDFYRRNGKNKALTEDDLWYEDDSPGIKAELSHCIEPFVNSLPEASSQLLMATDINGESQKDLAQSMGISYSTLKSRVQKARVELRGVFEECCHMKLDAQGNLMDYEVRKNKSGC